MHQNHEKNTGQIMCFRPHKTPSWVYETKDRVLLLLGHHPFSVQFVTCVLPNSCCRAGTTLPHVGQWNHGPPYMRKNMLETARKYQTAVGLRLYSAKTTNEICFDR